MGKSQDRRMAQKRIDDVFSEAGEQGFELAMEWLEIKLLDGTESNIVRAEAAQRMREMYKDVKKAMKK